MKLFPQVPAGRSAPTRGRRPFPVPCRDPGCEHRTCEAYRDGYEDGYKDGARDGYAAGYRDGWADGHASGFSAGMAAASRS